MLKSGVMRHSNAAARLLTGALALLLPGCSIKMMAINSLGNALAEGSSVYATDDDAELVWDAVPFGLKTIESLLEESPRHKGLLLAASSGFTQYAYGSLQQDADFIESENLARATALRERAKKLYLRARDYGLRGLDVSLKGFSTQLRQDSGAALARVGREQQALIYWTSAAWAAALALEVNDSELAADQSLVEAMMRRALALNDSWEYGTIHDFFVSWEGAHASVGGSYERAKQHLDKAVAYARGGRAWPLVSYAESVAVPRQNRAEFVRTLEQALAVDPGQIKEQRLTNILAQRRARWLLGRADELFIE
jgi:predicted anti-sigma-YlaC factor YlaD